MIKDLIAANRSYRRFYENETISRETLIELIELARLSASAANLQPLKYILSSEPARNELIFQTLAWAGYLQDWSGPGVGERPSAYIVVLGDTRISKNFGCDHGIASQNILLGAVERGLGGCMFGAINRENLRSVLDIPEHFEILLVIALGRPAEKVAVEPVGPDGSIRYYRDAEDVHHVPKRGLDEIVIG
jgi:nitroreductase